MKNGTLPLLRRVTSFSVAGAGAAEDIEIIYGGAGQQVVVQKSDDAGRLCVGISITQLPYVIRALTTLQAEIGDTEQPLAPSRKRTDVQGAILQYLNGPAGSLPADRAPEALMAELSLSRDQVVATLSRLKKRGKVIEAEGRLRAAPK